MDVVTVLGAFSAQLETSWKVWCSEIPAKKHTETHISKNNDARYLGSLGPTGEPILARNFGPQNAYKALKGLIRPLRAL